MKLKNKKTGEIVKFETDIYVDAEDITYEFSSLAKLNEEWEDCEEPKEYWFIDTYCYEVSYLEERRNEDLDNFNKEIGNYFETKEEAEKAVLKLKAWKRLKDDGFRLKTFYVEDREIVIRGGSDIASSVEMWHDLDLLFGGEE